MSGSLESYIFGGICSTLGLIDIVGSYSPEISPGRQGELFRRGILRTLIGSVVVVDPKLRIVTLVGPTVARLFLSPINAIGLLLLGSRSIRDSRITVWHIGAIVGGTVMACTQLAISILNNKNS